MAENFMLYSGRYAGLPADQMRRLMAGIAPKVANTARGLSYVYSWPDLSITCSEMPRDQVRAHLEALVEYVRDIGADEHSRTSRLVDRISRVALVAGIEIEPGRDPEGRTEHLLGALCSGLVPLVFFEDAVYDSMSRLILGPDGSFDDAADVEEA